MRSFVGLARRSGAIALGRSSCRRAAHQGKLRLLVLAKGAGGSVLRDSGAAENVPVLQSAMTKEEWGQQLGRSSVAVLGLTDADLARGLLQVAKPITEGIVTEDQSPEQGGGVGRGGENQEEADL